MALNAEFLSPKGGPFCFAAQGRVACEVNTADELLVTELIFNGVFNDLKPGQVVRAVGFC